MITASTEPKLSRISVDVQDSIAGVTLCNPPLNVIDIPMMEELAQAFAEIEVRTDISVVLVCADGKAFSAGVDVAAHTLERVEEMLAKFHAVVRALVATRKVTIAAVHGLCLGGGAELAMVCDMVYSSDDAEWA